MDFPEHKKKCKHKLSGMTGTICNKMDFYDPPQWGIAWESGTNFTKIERESAGIYEINGHTIEFLGHYFWNDKKLIEII